MSSDPKKVEMVSDVHIVWADGRKSHLKAVRSYDGVTAHVTENGDRMGQYATTTVEDWNQLIRQKLQRHGKNMADVLITEKYVLPCGVMEDEDQARGDEDE